nr:MAG TPA: hypothetical protein [Caudoviricetes sp.]
METQRIPYRIDTLQQVGLASLEIAGLFCRWWDVKIFRHISRQKFSCNCNHKSARVGLKRVKNLRFYRFGVVFYLTDSGLFGYILHLYSNFIRCGFGFFRLMGGGCPKIRPSALILAGKRMQTIGFSGMKRKKDTR